MDKRTSRFSTNVNKVSNAKNKEKMKTTYKMDILGSRGLRYNGNKKNRQAMARDN
jgi:hypothetical protein